MPVFKCKMCGGELQVTADMRICKCQYCGSNQTLPKLDNDEKIQIFDRANYFRLKNEFDKASVVYENIIEKVPNEAEAYWGLCLCKYGIEYVKDPKTNTRIPTCHRTQFDSILDDKNYISAIKYADIESREIYVNEANNIDKLQKNILSISQKEDPFDIFICYKETDDNNNRTIDSVIAQDIYTNLTNNGYKVFFSRITLEDKLGKEYEPYIFSALNSSKVMLVVGTKPEYFNAVWVKNEWARYLKLIEQGKSKVIIPCYKDISPYELPDEFASLQAQDLSKIGAMQDLLRGIEKVISEKSISTSSNVETNNKTIIKNILLRANEKLNSKDWEGAKSRYDNVLDYDKNNFDAHLGLFLANLKIKNKECLKDYNKKFWKNKNYENVIKNANEKEKQFLDKTKDHIVKKIKRKQKIEKISLSIVALCIVLCSISYLTFTTIIKSQIKDKQAKYFGTSVISAGHSYTVGLKSDGTVVAVGNNESSECNVHNWNNIIAINAGNTHTVGLKSDGTVVATGYNHFGQCNVKKWKDIVAIDAGYGHTVGLKSDGTVVAVGSNSHGQCDVQDWKDIVAISAGDYNTVGLKSDGTVVAVGNNSFGKSDVVKWKDIVAISAGYSHTVGIKSDGTVVAVGKNEFEQCNVNSWNDIVAISAGNFYTVGLKSDGTVVAVGNNVQGQCDVQEWKDIVAISAGYNHTVGLKSDGTAIAVGNNSYGKCNVDKWKDIRLNNK